MPAWSVVSASVTGASHLRNGQPCQDYQEFRCVSANASHGALIAAVADGAGSASLSEDGSRIAASAAVRKACSLISRHVHPLYEAVLKEVLDETARVARKELEAESCRRKVPIRRFATTLIIAICTADAVASAQIGDGAVVISESAVKSSSEEQEYMLFSPPQRGEYVNETKFITSNDWRESLAIKVRRAPVRHLAMFTDGMQSLALNASADNAPFAPFFTPMFRWAEKQSDAHSAKETLEGFLSSPRVIARVDDEQNPAACKSD